ncbi:MAG: carboxypeptidase-like regulatory domain-containing protein [Caldilineaceae bacterium]
MYQLQPSPRNPQKSPIVIIGLVCGVLLFCLLLLALWNSPQLLRVLYDAFPPKPALQEIPRSPLPSTANAASTPVVDGTGTGDIPSTPAPTPMNGGQSSGFPLTPTPTWPPPPTPTPIGGGPSLGFPPTPTPAWAPPPGFTPEPTLPPPPPDCNGASMITGRVVSLDGQPPSNVSVAARASDNNLSHCAYPFINEKGEFTVHYLPAGAWTLQAIPYPLAPRTSMIYPSQSISVMVDGVNPISLAEPLRLRGPQVTGQIMFANGKPGVNIAVGIFASETGNCPDPANATFSIGAALDNTGHFQVGGLPKAGQYCVQLMTLWDKQIASTTPFTLNDVANAVDLGVITLPTPPKHITGSIHDKQGAPIPSRVHLGRKAGNNYTGAYLDLQSDATGVFGVDVSGGSWEVSIQPIDQAWNELGTVYTETVKTINFAMNEGEETQDLALVLTMPPSVAGRILAPDGQPLVFDAGRYVAVELADSTGNFNQTQGKNENGLFVVRAMPGQNWLRLVVHGFTDYFPSGLRQVQVKDGESVNLGDLRLVGIVQVTGLLLRTASEPVPQRVFRLLPVATKDQCPATVAALPTPTPPPQPEIPAPGPPPQQPSGTELLYTPSGEISGFTDSQGRIRLGGLPVGGYCLVILSPYDESPLAAAQPRFFEIKDGASPLDLGAITLPWPSKQIIGVARTTTGAPIPGDAYIGAVRQAPQGLSNTFFNGDGSFNIPVTDGAWVVSIKQMDGKPPAWSVLNNDQVVHFAADATAETQTLTFTIALPGAAPAASPQFNLYLPLVNK